MRRSAQTRWKWGGGSDADLLLRLLVVQLLLLLVVLLILLLVVLLLLLVVVLLLLLLLSRVEDLEPGLRDSGDAPWPGPAAEKIEGLQFKVVAVVTSKFQFYCCCCCCCCTAMRSLDLGLMVHSSEFGFQGLGSGLRVRV